MKLPAPVCKAALAQATRMAPSRSTVSDGICGDEAHAARTSDHNPGGAGYCHAVDITHDPSAGLDAREVYESIRLAALQGRERRVTYIITHGRIASARYGWTDRPYSGSNPHTSHIHISIRDDRGALEDTTDLPMGEDDEDEMGMTPYRLTTGFVTTPEARKRLHAVMHNPDGTDRFAHAWSGPAWQVHAHVDRGLQDVERLVDADPEMHRFDGIPVEAGTHEFMGAPVQWAGAAYVMQSIPDGVLALKARILEVVNQL